MLFIAAANKVDKLFHDNKYTKTPIVTKLKVWNQYHSWEEAEASWNAAAKKAAEQQPLKGLMALPTMVGITPETAKGLKWKALKWMVSKDEGMKILKGFLKHPLRYGWRLIRSLLGKQPFRREGDLFFYNVDDLEAFSQQLKDPNAIFVVGFSYCHKPFECPSGRFTDQCIHDVDNPICRQCFIGKCMHAAPERNTIPLVIPTVHYIGGHIVDLVNKHPDKKILFLITACEMTLTMFGDYGNMAGIQGVGIRLDGRICNTMKAFELSEQGIKPGLTVVLEPTKQKVLDLLRQRGALLP